MKLLSENMSHNLCTTGKPTHDSLDWQLLYQVSTLTFNVLFLCWKILQENTTQRVMTAEVQNSLIILSG
jgi:hypothetical protein